MDPTDLSGIDSTISILDMSVDWAAQMTCDDIASSDTGTARWSAKEHTASHDDHATVMGVEKQALRGMSLGS